MKYLLLVSFILFAMPIQAETSQEQQKQKPKQELVKKKVQAERKPSKALEAFVDRNRDRGRHVSH